MNHFYSFLYLVARLTLGVFFIWKGVFLVNHWTEAMQNLEHFILYATPLWLILSLVLYFVGGIFVLLGFYTRLGAVLLFINLLFIFISGPVWTLSTPIYSLWALTDAYAAKMAEMGICLVLIGIGSGDYLSLDRRRKK
jgi:uncharacterized membrane protein YphA (DoxX/SURF4 family)